MSGLDYLATMTEAQFQNQVILLAQRFNWSWYHTHDSRRSPAGFPDLVLTRDGLLIFAELKAQNGRTSKLQEGWLDRLGKVAVFSPSMIVRLWRPQDLPGITKLLESGWRVKVS